MRNYKCLIHGCGNSYDPSQRIFIHSFPKDKTIQLKWIDFVNKVMELEGIQKVIKIPSKSPCICSIHFEESDFSNAMQFKMGFASRLCLKKEAVPKKFIMTEVSNSESKPGAHNTFGNKFIEQENIGAQSMSASHNNLTPYNKELCQGGKKLNTNVLVEKFTVQNNILWEGLVENLEDDVKIEEVPVLEDNNIIIDMLDKEKQLSDHRNTPEYYGVSVNIPDNDKVPMNTPEYICTDDFQISFMEENAENRIEKENENSKLQNKNIKKNPEREKSENLIEIDKENSKYKEKNPKYKHGKYAEKEGVDYRKKYVDIILSEESEYNKKMKDKIFDEDNYVDCTNKDCDLVVFGEHIENHLQSHTSIMTKGIKCSNKGNNIRTFICTECGDKFISFDNIANHVFTHFKHKAPKERVCKECGYKNKRLTAFKIHKCINLKGIIENSSKVLKNKDELDATTKQDNKIEINEEMSEAEYSSLDDSDTDELDSTIEQVNKKEIIKELSDAEYNPSDDSDTENHSSGSDSDEDDNEMQNIKADNSEMIAKLKVVCNRCQEEFENDSLCKEHLNKVHNVNIQESPANHIKKEVNKKLGIKNYFCLKCNKIYYSFGSCYTHISANHPEIIYHCNQCDFMTCKMYIIDHIKKKHEYQRYKCEICKKSYTKKKNLRYHMLTTHTSKPKKNFLCFRCGKVFKMKSKLDIHLLIHTGKKPFACKLCKFSTVQKYNLVVHMKSHERGTIKTSKR